MQVFLIALGVNPDAPDCPADPGLPHGLGRKCSAQALEIMAKVGGDPFDLVFSDVKMPGMTGIELARLVRNRNPDLPVVLTSGYSAVIAEQGSSGFELIQKPYTSNTLVRAFHKAIAERA